MVWELTGAANLDPRPFTLSDLSAIAASRWDHTSSIVSAIYALGGQATKRSETNPWRVTKVRGASGNFREKTKALGLPKWEPPT